MEGRQVKGQIMLLAMMSASTFWRSDPIFISNTQLHGREAFHSVLSCAIRLWTMSTSFNAASSHPSRID